MGIVVAVVVPILSAIGFGSAGPVAGSVATGVQSVCCGGAVKSGSAFAAAQSVAMKGILWSSSDYLDIHTFLWLLDPKI